MEREIVGGEKGNAYRNETVEEDGGMDPEHRERDGLLNRTQIPILLTGRNDRR